MNISRALTYSFALYIAATGLFTRFFYVEDAVALFHVFNYSDATFPFYYAGYISLLPQTVAYLASNFSPVVQAFLYAAFPALLSIWMVRRLLLLDISPWIILSLLSYVALFDSTYFFNLSYSIWISLTIIGLILCSWMREGYQIRASDAASIAFLSLSSPLSIAMVPGFIVVAIKRGLSVNLACSALFVVASAFVLQEPGGSRTGASDVLTDLSNNLAVLMANPWLELTLRGTNLPISVEQLVEVSSLVCLMAIGCTFFASFFSHSRSILVSETAVLAPLAAGGLACLIIGLGVASVPLGSRYYFVSIVCSTAFLSIVTSRFPERYIRATGLLILAGAVSISGYRLYQGLDESRRDFALLLNEGCTPQTTDYRYSCNGAVVARHKNWDVAIIPDNKNSVIEKYCQRDEERTTDSFIIRTSVSRYICKLPNSEH